MQKYQFKLCQNTSLSYAEISVWSYAKIPVEAMPKYQFNKRFGAKNEIMLLVSTNAIKQSY